MIDRMLNKLTQGFLARIPVSKLDWQFVEGALSKSAELDRKNDSEDNMLNCQEHILNVTVHHPLNLKYPLPNSYIQSFLKQLISKIEEYNCEIHSHILEKYTDLVSRNISDEDSGYRTFLLNEKDTSISLRENLSIISDGTTGLCTWQAAFYLAEWCIYNFEKIAGRRVVELGSGAGLVGLTCYKMCYPKFITMTDFHPKVLETLDFNVKTNVPSELVNNACIKIQSLDWVEFSRDGSCLPADLVLASDVVYDVDLIPALVATLSKLLDPKNTQKMVPTAIVVCTERNEETLNYFLSQLAIHHLTYKCLDHAPVIFACQRNFPVKIYQIIHSIKAYNRKFESIAIKVTGVILKNGTRAKRNFKRPKRGWAQHV